MKPWLPQQTPQTGVRQLLEPMSGRGWWRWGTQLSLCTEEGPKATVGLNGRTEVTSTLDKPRRGTRARFLADLQPSPNVQARAQFAERRRGTRKGPLRPGMSHHEELEGGGGLRTSQHVPSAAAAQLQSNGRMEKGTLNPLTPSAAAWDPRVLQAGETGVVDNGDGGTATGQVCPRCSRKNLQETLRGGWERFREQRPGGTALSRWRVWCATWGYRGPTAAW